MYRPLVQPKLHTSRGQPVSPGVSLLATGGPKQRGKLVVPNPHLLGGAPEWTIATPCSTTLYLDGRVEANNVTDASCYILRATSLETLEADGTYEIVVVISRLEGAGDVQILLADQEAERFVGQPGYFLDYITLAGPVTNQTAEMRLINAANLSLTVDYYGVSRIK